MLKRFAYASVLLAVWSCLGCWSKNPSGQRDASLPPEGAKLRLLVVDDAPLAKAAERLSGEWRAQTGTSLEVQQDSAEHLSAETVGRADALICPSWQLGELASENQIRPLPASLTETRAAYWSDLFGLLKSKEVAWANRPVAVPFGSAVLVCYYRADLLERFGEQPPRTWPDIHRLAARLADYPGLDQRAPRAGGPWAGMFSPLGRGWAGLVLLARAAPYATHRENYSTLFDIQSMEPLIDGPPFVRALEELVADAQLGPPEQLAASPADARQAFWQGRCGLALTWPSAAQKIPKPWDAGVRAGLIELPGTKEVYDVGDRAWETRRADEDPHVPLLGLGGRIGVVPSGSRFPDAALQLLCWLSDRDRSLHTSTASPATTLFRHSHQQSAKAWVEEPLPLPLARQYAAITETTLSRRQWLFALRIQGRQAYLDALDHAVHAAVRGQQTPQSALRWAAEQWREITQRLGKDAQAKAYFDSLGVE